MPDIAQKAGENFGIAVRLFDTGQMPRAPDQLIARPRDQIGHLADQIGRRAAVMIAPQ